MTIKIKSMVKIILWWLISGILAFFIFVKSPLPTHDKYGLPFPFNGKGQTEPAVIRPGEIIKLMVGDKQQSINGLFRKENLEVIPLTMVDIWKDTNFETIKDEDTWDDNAYTLDVNGFRRYYFRLKDTAKTFTLQNIDFYPWIQFKVPENSDLIGTKQKFVIKFDYTSPFYLRNKVRFEVRGHSIRDTVSFVFNTVDKIKKYDDWQSEKSKIESRNSLIESGKYLSAISFIIASIFLFLAFFDSGDNKR